MTLEDRRHQSRMASFYVVIIMMVSWYAGQLVMNTFGIFIPGLLIAGDLIVAFIGFRMLFPPAARAATRKENGVYNAPSASIAFVPLAMPGTVGPGMIAMIISSAATVKTVVTFPVWRTTAGVCSGGADPLGMSE